MELVSIVRWIHFAQMLCLLQLPVGCEERFAGVIDVIAMRKFLWANNQTSRTPSVPMVQAVLPCDAQYCDALKQRRILLEAIAELDEVFMEKYLEGCVDDDGLDSHCTTGDKLAALRRVCIQGTLVPVLCSASLRGKGVEPLLDAVLAFLPSPLDRPAFKAVHKEKKGDVKHFTAQSPELCALAFKVIYDAARGPLVYVRVFSGVIATATVASKRGGSTIPATALYNASHGKRERINQLLEVSADDLATMAECGPGGVCCIVSLKHTSTGDTLVAEGGPLKNYLLDGLTIHSPVFALGVEPERESQQTELEEALAILCMEDPSLTVEVNKESGQTLIKGVGELQLEIICDRLKRQFKIEVQTGKAYVAYRESLDPSIAAAEETKIVTSDSNDSSNNNAAVVSFLRSYTYDRTVAAKRLFAEMDFTVHLTGLNELPVVQLNKDIMKLVSADEYNAMLEALESALSRGPRSYPIVGINITVMNLRKDQDTTPGAVRACCSLFISDLLRQSSALQLLEPLMSVEVEVPERFVGDVLSDLTVQRRSQIGEIASTTTTDNDINAKRVIHAMVPLAAMLGYANSLRSITQGEGSFTAEYCSHVAVDPDTAAK